MLIRLKWYGGMILLLWMVGCGQTDLPTLTPVPPSDTKQPPTESKPTDAIIDLPMAEATMQLDVEPTMPALSTDFPNLPQVQPVTLPANWQTAQAVVTTADVNAAIMQTVLAQSPALLNDLSPEMWRALPVEALTVSLPALPADFDPVLKSQLQLIQALGLGEKPPAQPLPTAWVAAASYVGLDATTTDQMTSSAFLQIRAGTPELLDTLTDEIVLGFPVEVLALLPPELLDTLHPDTQQTIEIAILRAVGQ